MNNTSSNRKFNSILVLTLIFIFVFWLLLSKNNYFHMDDWEYIGRFNENIWPMLTRPFFEMFLPLNILLYYILYRLFGLSYLPFQINVLFFHTLNCLLLYLIIKRESGKKFLAYGGMVIFGLSSVPIDDIIWSMGINHVLAGTFLFLTYLIFIMFRRGNWLSSQAGIAILLYLSFHVHNITILFPLTYIIIILFDKGRNKKVFSVSLFLLLFILEVSTLLFFSRDSIAMNPRKSPLSLAFVPLYILVGVFKGTILRLITPDLYFLSNITKYTGPLRGLLSLILIFTPFVIIVVLKKNYKDKPFNFSFLKYILLIITPYMAIAPFRIVNGYEQARIPRYTYIPLFFLVIFLMVIFKTFYNRKILLTLFFSVLMTLHLISAINFSINWEKNLDKDQSYVKDIRYLLEHNQEVYDIPSHGIWANMSPSKLAFLFEKEKRINFLESSVLPPKEDLEKVSADQKTTEIYKRLGTIYYTFSANFTVPYSF